MWTLGIDGALMDSLGDRLRTILELEKYHVVIIFFVFMLLSAMTLMNMLVGVLCEVVASVAAEEKEEADVKLMKTSVLLLLNELDKDGNASLDKREWAEILQNEAATAVLSELQVNVGHLHALHDMFMERDC